MAIQISGTTVIDNGRNITNVLGVGDTSTTVYYGDGSNLTGIGGSVQSIQVEALLIGGGGGSPPNAPYAGYAARGGAGGGGEFLYINNIELAIGVSYPITVGGGGGASAIANPTYGIVAPAGGNGSAGNPAAQHYGVPVASGSAGGGLWLYWNTPRTLPGGTGGGTRLSSAFDSLRNTRSAYGGNGGAGVATPSYYSQVTGGGGGAGGNGGPTSQPGAGKVSSITGSPVTYAAGGAGMPNAIPAATANTGNGAPSPTKAGGSGVVIIAYPTDYPAASSTTGTVITPTRPGYHVYQFNSSGSITI